MCSPLFFSLVLLLICINFRKSYTFLYGFNERNQRNLTDTSIAFTVETILAISLSKVMLNPTVAIKDTQFINALCYCYLRGSERTAIACLWNIIKVKFQIFGNTPLSRSSLILYPLSLPTNPTFREFLREHFFIVHFLYKEFISANFTYCEKNQFPQ